MGAYELAKIYPTSPKNSNYDQQTPNLLPSLFLVIL